MNKIYVLDTNILLLDPKSILAFEDRNIIIPLKVIEELDKKKTMVGEIGYNARETFRILKDLKKDGADLWHGVPTEKGGIIRIEKAEKGIKETHSFYPGCGEYPSPLSFSAGGGMNPLQDNLFL